MNERTGRPLATHLEPAFDSSTRRRGLLGRSGLEPGTAVILAPCNSIHTFFMRFPIDVVFVNREGRVLRVCPALRSWRVALAWRAHAAVELGAGQAANSGTREGDALHLVQN